MRNVVLGHFAANYSKFSLSRQINLTFIINMLDFL